MIDAGYNYDRLSEKMEWLGLDPPLKQLRNILIEKNIQPVICTGHTGWTDDFEFAFGHIDRVCNAWKMTQKPVDPTAPENGYDESDDTEEKVHSGVSDL